MNKLAEWVGVDWGTSNVRAWGISKDGDIAFTSQSDKGMSRLTSQQYPDVLIALLDEHVDPKEPLDIVICGMAGAKQGWLEAPYIDTPASLEELGSNAVVPSVPNANLQPHILSGVCQRLEGEENVMRGEETQLLGLLALKPGFSGTVCMPGTHSKWVRIEDNRIISFSTAMTGELFELLRTHSVLRHSMPDEPGGADTEDGISAGLKAGIAAPHLTTTQLFRTRAAALLSDKSSHWCAGYLSGLLVGSEVAGHKDWIKDEPVPLLGSARLCRLYTNAFAMIGAQTETIDATNATLAGLIAARKQISK